MIKVHLGFSVAAFLMLALPASAQTDRRSTNTPRPSLSLNAPQVSSTGYFIRCKVLDMAMSDEGLGFTCVTGDNTPYLVATTGADLPGGIAANLSLVMKMLEQPSYYRRLRVKPASGGALRVCGLLRGASPSTDGVTCVQAMAIRMSSADTPVNSGDANPSGPNIPTGSPSSD